MKWWIIDEAYYPEYYRTPFPWMLYHIMRAFYFCLHHTLNFLHVPKKDCTEWECHE